MNQAGLTPRQRQVMAFMVKGDTAVEIGVALSISPRTVEVHRSDVLRLHGARNTRHLVAILAGVGQAGPVRQRKAAPRLPKLSPAQLRAARGLLHWTLEKTAAETGTTAVTLTIFENGKRALRVGTESAILDALDRANVEAFDDDTGVGVRLRRP